MQRTHSETQEQIAARTEDFVNGDASEAVLKASLKALGLDKDDVNFYFWKASVARTQALKEKQR